METFLTFILITVLSLYLLGFLGRLLLRWWIARKQRELAERFGQAGFGGFGFGQQPPGGTPSGQRRREGEVKVERTEVVQQTKVDKSVGEYVEFEEVEDSSTR